MEHSAVTSNPAIAILRVSSMKQGMEGDSPEDQRKAILPLAASEGFHITHVFEWIQSASIMTDAQPAWEAVTYCKNHPEIQRCYIKSIDRFTRGGADDYLKLDQALRGLGVSVSDVYGVISNKEVNTMGHLGKSYPWSVSRPSLSSELLEAERVKNEFAVIMARLTSGSIGKVRSGYTVGPPAYGYKNVRIETETGKKGYVLEPEESESSFILRMYELAGQGMKKTKVVDEINTLGFKTRVRHRRKKVGSRIVRAGKIGEVPLTEKQLERFLEDPIYCGVQTHSHLISKDYSTRIEHYSPILIRGIPIVSVELWNRANGGKKSVIVHADGTAEVFKGAILERYAVKKTKQNQIYPYKGYLACHFCGHPLKASAPRSKSGKHVVIYHCGLGHPYWGTNGKRLHEAIESLISHLEFSEEFRAKFRTIFLEEWEKRRDQANQASIDHEKEVLHIKERQRSILDLMPTISVPPMRQAYEKQYAELENELVAAMTARDHKETEEFDVQTVISYCNYWMEHLQELLMDREKPLESARLFSLCFDEAPTVPQILDGTPKLSLLFRLNDSYRQAKNSHSEPGEDRTHDTELKRLLLYH